MIQTKAATVIQDPKKGKDNIEMTILYSEQYDPPPSRNTSHQHIVPDHDIVKQQNPNRNFSASNAMLTQQHLQIVGDQHHELLEHTARHDDHTLRDVQS